MINFYEIAIVISILGGLFLVFSKSGKIIRKSVLLYFIIMFPKRRWHLPSSFFAKIKIEEHKFTSPGGVMNPDIYYPDDGKKHNGMIIFVPLAKEGKKDYLVVNFLRGLARLGYVIMAPHWVNRQMGIMKITDSNDLCKSIEWFSKFNKVDKNNIGVMAVSYGVGPSIISLVKEKMKNKIKYLVIISGYYDLLAVAKNIITKKFNYKNLHGEIIPDPYARYALFYNAASWTKNKFDQSFFKNLAKKIYNNKSIAKINKSSHNLSANGQAILNFLLAKNTTLFKKYFAKLPATAINFMSELSPKKLTNKLSMPVLILHSTNDRLIPYTESLKIYDSLPVKRETTFALINAFDHTVPVPATLGNILRIYLPNFVRLVRFIYKMLSYQ